MSPFLASDGGAIEHLVLFVPEDEAENFAAIYTALIGSLPSDCAVTALVESAALEAVRGWALGDNARARLDMIEVPDLDFTAWARDPLLALREGEGAQFLVTAAMDRRDDRDAARALEQCDGITLKDAPIRFEGGNMLVGEDHMLVGADTLNMLEDPAMIRELVPKECPVIVLGTEATMPQQFERSITIAGEGWREIFHYFNKENTRQPIFHIDMFVTLAGRDKAGAQRVLVGDPQLAADVLGAPLHPHSLADAFDEIAADLAGEGMAVIRNPLPMIYMDDVEARTRVWFYVSSNNVLVQNCAEEGRIVWLPEFGHDHWPQLSQTDAANRAIWEELGFEVRMIPEAQRLAENLGGLHCLTNVAARG